ncbi:MAG: Ser/Thr protein kinase RdoA (MazF antagonist), partial [Planctomycetaceae bacterium]
DTDPSLESLYVLRLHRPGYHTLAELESERLWISALDEARIAVPEAVRTRDGAEYVEVTLENNGKPRYAGLARWTTGEILQERLQQTPETPTLLHYFEQLGIIMANMHNQACNWQIPESFTRHRLNSDGLLGDVPFWGPFWEHPTLSATERALLLSTRDQVRQVLTRYGHPTSTYSLIHADMHPGNLLLNEDQLTVIDFDDAGFGWHQYDIAVALVSQQEDPHFDAIQQALMSGYRSRREFSSEAEAMIPMFRMIRGMATIGWIMQRAELNQPLTQAYIQQLCQACETFKASTGAA